MLIGPDELRRVKVANDLVDVARGHGIELRRRGRSYFGRCPFHAEQVPSFAVSREAGLYHCFGCGAGGDVIRFIERGGPKALITSPESIERALNGETGTWVVPK